MRNKTAKRKVMVEHRDYVYERSLDKLMAGQVPPEYVTERWQKLKQIKGGK